eukprot:scaffold1091_cov164-Ochromonas_danica.AAC.3
MPTGWSNANESSPPGVDGDFPSNAYHKVVRAQVLPTRRSRSNTTEWYLRVSFYLRGNKKRKAQQVVTASGYATEEAAKAQQVKRSLSGKEWKTGRGSLLRKT